MRRLPCPSSVAFLAPCLTAAALAGAAGPAQSIGVSTPIFSISLEVSRTFVLPFVGPVTIKVDPDGVQTIDLELAFDPNLFSFVDAGFLCDFSENGSCPPVGGFTGPASITDQSVTLGDPLGGSVSSIVVDPIAGLLSLSYDLSGLAAPPAVGTNRHFFGFNLQPKKPVRNTVVYETLPGSYDVTVLSATCTAIDGGQAASCGSDTPITGVSFSVIPLPPALPLLAGGLFALAALRRRRT